VIYVWPDQQHLNHLRKARADAIVVIEWGMGEAATWVEDTQAICLLPGQIVQPTSEPDDPEGPAPGDEL
jgi:hypothetical protein